MAAQRVSDKPVNSDPLFAVMAVANDNPEIAMRHHDTAPLAAKLSD
jgi:hypothetical protein